jgi:hypothetical protein
MGKTNLPGENIPDIERPKEITPLKVEIINGVRTRVKAILKKWGALVLAGGILGGTAGGVAQSKYRDLTGYDPDKAAAAEAGDNEEQKQKEEEQKTEEQKEAMTLLEKARERLRKAKDMAVDKVNQTKVVKDYKKAVDEVKETYSTMMKVGDKASFWLPFLLMFLATVYLGNKAIKIKKSLTQRADPVIDKNMKAMEKKINELIKAVNEISNKSFVSAEEAMKMQDEIKKLYEKFEAQNPAIEKEISGSTEAAKPAA